MKTAVVSKSFRYFGGFNVLLGGIGIVFWTYKGEWSSVMSSYTCLIMGVAFLGISVITRSSNLQSISTANLPKLKVPVSERPIILDDGPIVLRIFLSWKTAILGIGYGLISGVMNILKQHGYFEILSVSQVTIFTQIGVISLGYGLIVLARYDWNLDFKH